MLHRISGFVILLGLGSGSSLVLADQFDQLDGPVLLRMIKGPTVKARPGLTLGEVGAMPALLRDSRSALILASTDRGNPARLLLVPELRKPASGVGEPIPVMVLERLDVFDATNPSDRLASRRDVVLFDGLPIDLDSGQVVPEGQGGDLVFRAVVEGGPRLEPLGSARLFSISQPLALDDPKIPRPTPGRSVVPEDFAGRYRLFANGQWSGTLDLKVEPRGVVTGKFRSDLHGSNYPVTGQVATDSARKVRFSISFPRARQEYEGYLWGEGKGAMAGTVNLGEQTFGYFALREGGRAAPETSDLGPIGPLDRDRPGRIIVEVQEAGLAVDRKPTPLENLVETLNLKAESDPTPWILIRVSTDRKFGDLLPITRSIEKSGISTIRFEFVEPR